MNNPALITSRLSDVQGTQDTRNIAIDRVGIKDLKHPVIVSDRSGRRQHAVASFCMYISLPHNRKGAHMSRFVELLNGADHVLTVATFRHMLVETVELLDADSAYIESSFTYFVEKAAPVTGMKGLMDYQVSLIGKVSPGGIPSLRIKVVVPVTTLCPCAKEISDYGAHNQRSHITVEAEIKAFVYIEDMIDIAESVASCELYSVLKREDEKYVTERAYDNPRFVEDLVRELALRLNDDERFSGYTIEAENFESIHNHSAYARITNDSSSGASPGQLQAD